MGGIEMGCVVILKGHDTTTGTLTGIPDIISKLTLYQNPWQEEFSLRVQTRDF